MIFDFIVKSLPDDLKMRVADRLEDDYGTNEFVEMIHEASVNPFSKFKIVYAKTVLKEILKIR